MVLASLSFARANDLTDLSARLQRHEIDGAEFTRSARRFMENTRDEGSVIRAFRKLLGTASLNSEVPVLLLPLLESQNITLRAELAQAFKLVLPGNQAVLHGLIQRLNDPSPHVVQSLIYGLTGSLSSSPETRLALTELLNHPDSDVQSQAMLNIREYAAHDENVRLALENIARSGSEFLRKAARTGLQNAVNNPGFHTRLTQEIADADEHRLDEIFAAYYSSHRYLKEAAIDGLLNMAGSSRAGLSRRAIHALRDITFPGEAAATEQQRLGLFRLLLHPTDSSVPELHRAMYRLFFWAKAKHNIAPLTEFLDWLRSQDIGVTARIFARDQSLEFSITKALGTIANTDERLLPLLMVMLRIENLPISTQRSMLGLIARGVNKGWRSMGTANYYDDGRMVRHALGAFLRPPHPVETRLAALEALRQSDAPETGTLNESLARDAIPLLNEAAPHATETLRILRNYVSNPVIWSAVAQAARRSDISSESRYQTFKSLVEYAIHHQNELPAFIPFTQSPEESVRHEATMLMFLSESEDIPIERVMAALSDGSPRIRAHAATNLQRPHFMQNERVLDAVRERLRDPDPLVRSSSIWVLATKPSTRLDGLISLLADPDSAVASEALQQTNDYLNQNLETTVVRKLANAIAPLTRSAAPLLRGQAMGSLARLLPQDQTLIFHFVPRLADVDPVIRKGALRLTEFFFGPNSFLLNLPLDKEILDQLRKVHNDFQEALTDFRAHPERTNENYLDKFLPYSSELRLAYLERLGFPGNESAAVALLNNSALLTEPMLLRILNYVTTPAAVEQALAELERRLVVADTARVTSFQADTLMAVSEFLNRTLPAATHERRPSGVDEQTLLRIRNSAARILSAHQTPDLEPVQAMVIADRVQKALSSVKRHAPQDATPSNLNSTYRTNANPNSTVHQVAPEIVRARDDLVQTLRMVHVDTDQSPSFRARVNQWRSTVARTVSRWGIGSGVDNGVTFSTASNPYGFRAEQFQAALRRYPVHTLKASSVETPAEARADLNQEVDAILAERAQQKNDSTGLRVSADEEPPYLPDEDVEEWTAADDACVTGSLRAQVTK